MGGSEMHCRINIDDLEFEDASHALGYASRSAPVAQRIGARKLGYRVIEIPPGNRAWPMHHHYVNEEMFFILTGSGLYGYGDQSISIKAGDILSAVPGGPDHSHQLINNSSVPLRYLAVSTMEQPDIVGYPESGKFAVFAGSGPGGQKADRTFEFVGKLADRVGYWDEQ